MGTGMRVEIEYANGMTEIVKDIPTAGIASGVYAEAVGNYRVRRAVLYRGDGTEARSYPNAASAAHDEHCGRRVDPRRILDGTDPARLVCAREPGHRGRHRDTRSMSRVTMVWDDDACPPLDSAT